jgi:serine/threonine protein kinase
MKFTRDKEIGSGTYGTVYSGEVRYKDGKKERGAMKKIYHCNNIAGIGVFREIQILQMLSSRCTHFPKLIGIFFDDYKRKSRNNTIRKEEYLTFITEILSYSGEKAFGVIPCTINTLIDMSSQLICAVAFMHSKFITHRDIKPANILLSFDNRGKPLLKLCDFGLSQFLSNSTQSTPGTNSPWYRAPEICWRTPKYGSSSDVWAVGVTIFQMLTGSYFVESQSADDQHLFYKILEVNPNQWTSEIHEFYKRSSSTHFLINGSTNPVTLSAGENLLVKFKKSPYYRESDDPVWLKFQEFVTKCLNYNFSERISCWALLSESIFDPVREHISEIKAEIKTSKTIEIVNFSVPEEINLVKIRVLENFIKITRGRIPIRHMFHSADLANRVFSSPVFLKESNNPELITAACIYFFHKYFSVITIPDDVDYFFEGIGGYTFIELRNIEKDIIKQKIEQQRIKEETKNISFEQYQINLAEVNNKLVKLDSERLELEESYHRLCEWIYNFELKMLREIFYSFHIFRTTVYEMAEEYRQILSNEQAVIIFREYIKISEWNNTYRFMYRQLYHKCIDKDFKFVLSDKLC